jgi:hypothetical protein
VWLGWADSRGDHLYRPSSGGDCVFILCANRVSLDHELDILFWLRGDSKLKWLLVALYWRVVHCIER